MPLSVEARMWAEKPEHMADKSLAFCPTCKRRHMVSVRAGVAVLDDPESIRVRDRLCSACGTIFTREPLPAEPEAA